MQLVPLRSGLRDGQVRYYASAGRFGTLHDVDVVLESKHGSFDDSSQYSPRDQSDTRE
jgi:hypothetical protein